jgi:hypothetical protein
MVKSCEPIRISRHGSIKPEILALVEKQTGRKATTEHPADRLQPGLEGYRKPCVEKNLPTDDETVGPPVSISTYRPASWTNRRFKPKASS